MLLDNKVGRMTKTNQIQKWYIGLLLVLSFGMTSCEQIKPIEDRMNQELKENTQKQEDLLAPLAGRYEGMMDRSAASSASEARKQMEPAKVRLVLVPNTIIVQNPGRNDITLYPTLGGTLSILESPLRQGDEESVIPVAHYSMAKFDDASGRLRLNGNYSSVSAGSVMVYLDGVCKNGHITGRAFSSLTGDLGTVELDRLAD